MSIAFDAVFFDLDGTLLDTSADFETAINALLVAEGREPLANGAIRSCISDGSIGIVKAAFDLEASAPELPRLRQALLDNYRTCMTEHTRVFEGLDTVLDVLASERVPWGLVTNKPESYAAPIVSALVPECAVLICPDHIQQNKPDPEGLLLASGRLSVTPARCVYVGDHIRDIEAGKSASMTTVVAGWGYIDPAQNPLDWRADYLVEQPADLIPILSDRHL